jgi:magnesium transporter
MNKSRPRGRTRNYVRRIKRRSDHVGLAPGLLKDIPQTTERVKIEILDYDEKHVEEKEAHSIDECRSYKETPTVTWINVEGPYKSDILGALQESFVIHSLAVEDIATASQRPKVDVYDDYAYVALRQLHYDDRTAEVNDEQISIILGKHYVITFSESQHDIFDILKERVRSNEEHIRTMGADYLAYAIIDIVVDGYFVILEKLGERIEFIEEQVAANPTSKTLQEIHGLKTEIVYMRESLWPLREVVDATTKKEIPLITATTISFLRDVYDNVIHAIDILETFRDIVSGILDIYLSSVSLKLNEVMKVLTIVGTIFLPLGFIAAVYGMNFPEPEVRSEWGYPAFWLASAVIVIAMLIYFRRRGWIISLDKGETEA